MPSSSGTPPSPQPTSPSSALHSSPSPPTTPSPPHSLPSTATSLPRPLLPSSASSTPPSGPPHSSTFSPACTPLTPSPSTCLPTSSPPLMMTSSTRTYPEEAAATSCVKYSMRHQCVPQIARHWLDAISLYRSSDPALTTATLETMKWYISWIDITLVTNDAFIPLLFDLILAPGSLKQLRSIAAGYILAIVLKRMDPSALLSSQHPRSFVRSLEASISMRTPPSPLLLRISIYQGDDPPLPIIDAVMMTSSSPAPSPPGSAPASHPPCAIHLPSELCHPALPSDPLPPSHCLPTKPRSAIGLAWGSRAKNCKKKMRGRKRKEKR